MGKASKQNKSAPQAKKALKQAANKAANDDKPVTTRPPVTEEIRQEYLPPLALVLTVIACSGFMFTLAFRDAFATGSNIAGSVDLAMLQFTKSLEFYDDSNGWKSTRGGLSTVAQVSTDFNNMGGLFVRKVGGAAGMVVQLQKLYPLLFHPVDARWKMGHFRPMLWTAVVANAMLAAFYGSYLQDLGSTGADSIAQVYMSVLILEATVIVGYLLNQRNITRGPAVAMPEGKKPYSFPSNILARTVVLASGLFTLLAVRDLFFPGQIMSFLPRDDVYLEWTNAFFHSPPEGTPEAEEIGLSAPFYIGDKFVSQLMGLNLLITCIYKFASAIFITYGSDGSGMVKGRIFWKVQCFGNALILFIVRLFASAAKSASLDMRWHLMALGYETVIFALYAFF